MFSGIVEALGRVEAIASERAGTRFTIAWPDLVEPFQLGESIAVNGCCLTVVASDGPRFDVQAGPETLARTTLGGRVVGDRVNLERALRLGDRLGGHFVQGHVDGTATVVERRTDGDWEFLRFQPDASDLTRLMVEKGSIAVDGVSLTIVSVDSEHFSVMLIPHTLAVTTLGTVRVGDRVNLEADMLAKHVAKLVAALATR